jgi:hypothetical protein
LITFAWELMMMVPDLYREVSLPLDVCMFWHAWI